MWTIFCGLHCVLGKFFDGGFEASVLLQTVCSKLTTESIWRDFWFRATRFKGRLGPERDDRVCYSVRFHV